MASSFASSSALQWLSLVSIIWLQSINGTNTNFPAYSSQLKQLLSISQVQLNNLAFAADAGKLLAWLSGIAAKNLPLSLVLLIGTLLGLIGYGFQYLFLDHQIVSLSYSQIFLLSILAGNSICWVNTACYILCMRNFPVTHRPAVVGLSTSYIGLSAKFYTAMADAFFAGKPSSFLLLNSVAPLVVSLVTAPFVRELENYEATTMEAGFVMLFVITIATGIYAMIGSVVFASINLINAVGLVALLAVPLVIPAVAAARGGKWWVRREGRVFDSTVTKVEVGVVVGEEEGKRLEVDLVEMGEGEMEVGREEEIGVKLMVRRVEFWLYFFMYMFGATLGLVFLNNLGQIAESRGNSNTSALLSLSSSFGFFGRLLPSLLDYFLSESRYMVSRPTFMAILMVPMAGAFFLLANNNDNICLYISTAILGACTGAITSSAVSVTSQLFGTKNFGVNHNVVVANIPLGSLLFGYLAALVYDKEDGRSGCTRCIGIDCYGKTFIVWGSFCSLGTFLSFLLYLRTRKYYQVGRTNYQ